MGENDLRPVASVHEIKSDAARAQEFKDRIRPLLEQQASLMDEARAHGMQLNWAITPNAFGKMIITEITVTKQI